MKLAMFPPVQRSGFYLLRNLLSIYVSHLWVLKSITCSIDNSSDKIINLSLNDRRSLLLFMLLAVQSISPPRINVVYLCLDLIEVSSDVKLCKHHRASWVAGKVMR